MIFDNIKNKELYLSIKNDGFKLGFEFIQKVERENRLSKCIENKK